MDFLFSWTQPASARLGFRKRLSMKRAQNYGLSTFMATSRGLTSDTTTGLIRSDLQNSPLLFWRCSHYLIFEIWQVLSLSLLLPHIHPFAAGLIFLVLVFVFSLSLQIPAELCSFILICSQKESVPENTFVAYGLSSGIR